MMVRMSRMLSCPRGHQWEASESGAADTPSCPICGIAVSTLPAASPSDSAPTVLQVAVSAAAKLEQQPPVLPDFDILEEIGRGGMGIVYRARQRGDGQIVAVKVIRK